MSHLRSGSLLAAATLAAALTLTACGDDGPSVPSALTDALATQQPATEQPTQDGATEPTGPSDSTESNDAAGSNDALGSGSSENSSGRAFDATDEAVVMAITAATRADAVVWEGSKLVLTFHEGSAEAPMSATKCTAVNTLIGAGETGELVYPDGRIDCSTR